jgi:hypothetical protein
MPNVDVAKVIQQQSAHIKSEFEQRTQQVVTQLAEQVGGEFGEQGNL